MVNLSNALVYDCETFPNVFTLSAEMLHSDIKSVWEISEFRDNRRELFRFFEYCRQDQIPMIGFFSLKFDYPLIHWLFQKIPMRPLNRYTKKSRALARNFDNFGNEVWQSERFAPQIDLFKINHFDNKSKRTSLKALEINMRSPTVVDMPVEFNKRLTLDETRGKLIPYNTHDVSETKRFAWHCMTALEFRIGLLETLKGDVLNFSDVKIGAKMLEQRIGEDICYIPAYTELCTFDNKTTIYHRKCVKPSEHQYRSTILFFRT